MMTAMEAFQDLSEGNQKVLAILLELVNKFGNSALASVLHKQLRGVKILELYELCGQDIERFDYHVCMELPNQVTGVLSIMGPYTGHLAKQPDSDHSTFWEARKHGKPNSFWALENPPRNRNYKFPLTAEGKENEV